MSYADSSVKLICVAAALRRLDCNYRIYSISTHTHSRIKSHRLYFGGFYIRHLIVCAFEKSRARLIWNTRFITLHWTPQPIIHASHHCIVGPNSPGTPISRQNGWATFPVSVSISSTKCPADQPPPLLALAINRDCMVYIDFNDILFSK